MTERDASWKAFCEATASRAPWPLLLDVADRFERPGSAIDLGCGAGNETRELLRRGWRVCAIDGERAAIEHLRATVPPEDAPRLETLHVSFEEMTLPHADLVWAGLSLSFTRRDAFDAVWAKVVEALRPGGRVACDLFGDRHPWGERGGTFLTEAEVHERLKGLDVEHFEEIDEERPTVFSGTQRLHAFKIIARKG